MLGCQNESDEDIQTIPTIGFNVETLQYKNIKFQVPHAHTHSCVVVAVGLMVHVDVCVLAGVQVWDLGGQTSIRPYWRCYYPNTDAIIFVVDR